MKAGEWTLRSRRVVTPAGTRAADVLIRKETIADLLPHDGPEAEGVILDVGDLAVLPGLVALHREPTGTLDGRWYEAVTRDSASGGVTTLIDLPPGLDAGSVSMEASLRRLSAAEGKIRVDCGLVVPLGHGNVGKIESWIEAGFLGVEAILGEGGPGDASHSTESDLRAAMPVLADLGRPLFVDSARSSKWAGPSTAYGGFAASLPEGEFAAIRLLIRLCRETHCLVHLIHPSASEALPMLAEARAEGLPITVATCPRHLSLAAEEVVAGVPTFPLDIGHRGPDDRGRLWDGLESGLIAAIGPDLPRPLPSRASIEAGEVERPTLDSRSLRLALPGVWAEARRRGFTLNHLARWLATKPADHAGLANRKGAIAAGLDADLVVFDPDVIPPAHGDHQPGLGAEVLAGQVEATILRGTMIYQAGQFFEHPTGSVVLRLEETQPIAGTDC